MTTTETTTALSETERWQIEEARALLTRWDRERGGPGVYTTERALADTVRGLLAIADQFASEDEGVSEREALVIAALDEAAADRIERAKPAGCPGCAVLSPGTLCPEHGEHFSRAQAYWAERDRLEAGR